MYDRKWTAKWIEYNPQPFNTNPKAVIKDAAPIFYKTFNLDKKPKNAKIYICGLGFYNLLINGKRIGDDILRPAFTAYDKRAFYNVYNITDELLCGDNKIEVVIGGGWFFENYATGWEFEHATWRARHQLICEIFADDALVLKTDSSWVCGKSKITYNSLRGGETYDNTADVGEHIHASVAHGPGGIFVEQNCPHIKLREVLEPKSVNGDIYDFGINITGNAEITVKGKRGATVTMQYSERLGEDGDVDFSRLLPYPDFARFQKDEYVLSGEGEETWHSEFGYNGFRYIKVTGDAEIISIKARHFHTDLQTAGGFSCDNDFFNELHAACVRSTLCNFHHMPTDCPHREKNGWTGDAHLSSEQAIFNLDMRDAYIKWLDDIADCQRPNGAIPCIAPTSIWGYNWGSGNAWDAVIFEIPWQLYRYYGDAALFERYLPTMKKYLTFLSMMGEDNIWRNGLGDWCAPLEATVMSTPAILTGYAYRMVHLYAKMNAVLGNKNESDWAKLWATEIRKTFIDTFEDKETDNQGLLSMQLYFDLTDKKDEIFARLVKCIEEKDYRIDCGIFGIKWMFTLLSEYGRHDIATRILLAEGYPGYKDMLNGTNGTLSENWRSSSSMNHHMYASIDEWFYKSVAGINLDDESVGFKNIKITPHLSSEYTEFSAWHQTPLGKVSVSFKNGTFDITIPDGTTADFQFEVKSQKLTKSAKIKI